MITLAHLRALLERALTHAKNPVLGRLTKRTVYGVTRVYLPRTIRRSLDSGGPEDGRMLDDICGAACKDWAGRRTLDLTDPGTAHALLVALTLALGLDPGVGGIDCSWSLINGNGWSAATSIRGVAFGPFKRTSGARVQHIHAPIVAAEPDPIKALGLAVLHVLGVKP